MSVFFDAAISLTHRHGRWLALFVLAQSCFWTTLACAQSPASTIEEFGLLGTWADDCSAAASPTNQYSIFSLTSRGNVELRNDFGPDYDEMLYRIVDAQRLSYFRLAFRQLLTSDDEIVLNTVMMKANNQIRIWSSHGSDGSAFVEYGVMPSANGQETGWMTRCNVRWTDDPDAGLKEPAFERVRKPDSPAIEILDARGEVP